MNIFASLRHKISHYSIKGKIITVLWITLIWTLIRLFRFFETYASNKDSIEFNEELASSILITIVAGLFVGASIVFLWERWLRRMAYFKAMFFIMLFYSLTFSILFSLEQVMIKPSNTNQTMDVEVLALKFKEGFNLVFLTNYIYWLVITFLTILFLFIRDKFGPITFVNFLKGKYLRPKREERIFMFMDLKSSTAIAERLGEERYFNFLNDTFRIATPGILVTQGEIYQYVGDEIVISWLIKNGVNRANCIRCYYEIIELLEDKSVYFDETYGTQPLFKAGLHFGHVITGEMGIVKREIVYSGDVLNTASRIQSLCNEMNTDILLSNNLMKQIDRKFLDKEFKSVGNITLRGKQQKIELVTPINND
ncbi:adenylate/guanylate cyclase domain-containing protein [Flavobacteriaceae sp. LMIT009]